MLDLVTTAVEKLKALGVKAGDRVGIVSANCPEFAVAVVALWKMGAVAVPVSTRLPGEVVDGLMSGVGAGLVLDATDLRDVVKYDKPVLKFCEFDSLGLDSDADASILFTSASTGRPASACARALVASSIKQVIMHIAYSR